MNIPKEKSTEKQYKTKGEHPIDWPSWINKPCEKAYDEDGKPIHLKRNLLHSNPNRRQRRHKDSPFNNRKEGKSRITTVGYGKGIAKYRHVIQRVQGKTIHHYVQNT